MKHAVAALSLMLVATGLFAITTKVVDTEGPATVQRASGKAEKAAIGKSCTTGDSIRTGKNGLVELSQDGLTIRIGPSTVFTLLEKEQGGKPKGVLAVTLGSVRMKYDRLTGSEPMIQSSSCIAGVRGTELTVWAGADGASLIAVDSGLVAVEAFGKTVELGASEAVQVINGQPPGDKFPVPKEWVDYSTWETGRIAAMIADPLGTVDGMRERLVYYIAGMQEYSDLLAQYSSRFKEESARAASIKNEQGDEAARRFVAEVVDPLRVQTGNLFLNFRYYILAGVSLRRFIGGRVYLMIKLRYLSELDEPTFRLFLDRYDEFLSLYETKLVPLASERDFY